MSIVEHHPLLYGEQQLSCLGPLHCFVKSFDDWLAGQGYATSTRRMKLNMIKISANGSAFTAIIFVALNETLLKTYLLEFDGPAGATATLSQWIFAEFLNKDSQVNEHEFAGYVELYIACE